MMLKEFVLFIVLVAVPTVRATDGDVGSRCKGGDDGVGGSCTDTTNANCNAQGMCVCNADFYDKETTCTARKVSSATCDGSIDRECVDGQTCQSSSCAISKKFGNSGCTKGNFECDYNGLVCNDAANCECKSTHYKEATNSEVCALLKILNGETCTNDQTCEDGNQCKAQGDDQTLKCTADGKLYGACTGTQGDSNRCGTPSTDHMECATTETGDVCECATDYYANDVEDTCPNEKLNAGDDCSTNPCKTGLTCDADVSPNRCKVPADGNCATTLATHCATGLTCVTDVCKIATGDVCNANAEGTDDRPCMTGTTCQKAADGTNKICKLNKDGVCNTNFEGDNLPCVDGTECKDKKEGDSAQGRVCKGGAGFLQASMLMVVVTVMASVFARG